MIDDTELSRRQALAAVGGASLLGFGSMAALPNSQPVTYNRLTYAQSNEPALDLRVDWAEYYNSNRVESQNELTDNEQDEPVVTLDSVLPGDHGRLAFGLSAESQSQMQQSVAVQMRLRLLANDENNRVQPEAEAGDDPDDPNDDFDGELGDYVDVTTWYDTGFNVGDSVIYGGCDGRFNSFGEGRIDELSGTFVDAASDSWVTIVGPDAPEDCLDVREDGTLCIGFQWELPGGAMDGESDIPDVNDNIIQSDRLEFGIEFRIEQCQT